MSRQDIFKLSLLITIVFIGVFLRFVYLPEIFHFADDEGRDMFIARSIITGADFPSLGPSASVGGFYLGPAYYYLIALALLFSFSPLGPVVMIAVFGGVSIFFIYKLGRKVSNKNVGLISAFIYATSFLIVLHERWAWNPNIMPFFIILATLFLFLVCKEKRERKKYAFLITLSVLLSIIIQLHATGFLFLLSVIIFLLIWPPRIKKAWVWLVAVGSFMGFLFPWLYYELSNNFSNLRAIINHLQESAGVNFLNRVYYFFPEFLKNLEGVFLGGEKTGWLGVALFVTILSIFIVRLALKKGKFGTNRFYWFFLIQFIVGILFYLLSSFPLFDHYFIWLWPCFVIIFSESLYTFWNLKKRVVGKFIVIAIVLLMGYSGISGLASHFREVKSRQSDKSYSVPFADQKHVIDDIVLTNTEIDFEYFGKDNYRRSLLYLLDESGVKNSKDSDYKALVYRESNPPENLKSPEEEIKEYGSLRVIFYKK